MSPEEYKVVFSDTPEFQETIRVKAENLPELTVLRPQNGRTGTNPPPDGTSPRHGGTSRPRGRWVPVRLKGSDRVLRRWESM